MCFITFDSISNFFTSGNEPRIRLIVDSNIKNIEMLPNILKKTFKIFNEQFIGQTSIQNTFTFANEEEFLSKELSTRFQILLFIRLNLFNLSFFS